MDIKDVVKGKRVKALGDTDGIIPVGAVGTLIETHTGAPYVDFDEHYEGCFEFDGFQNVRALTLEELEEI